MELVPRGSLFDLLHRSDEVWTFGDALKHAAAVADGMAFLHASGIIHRDLKQRTFSSMRARIQKYAILDCQGSSNFHRATSCRHLVRMAQFLECTGASRRRKVWTQGRRLLVGRRSLRSAPRRFPTTSNRQLSSLESWATEAGCDHECLHLTFLT